jgi:3-methyladenine DNA glycosylase/8-oxoguanine DNA glycosylase
MSLELDLPAPEPYHLRRSLVGHQMGPYDPTLRLADGAAEGAMNTPEGPASFEASRAGGHIAVRIHGPGREWLAGKATGLFGLLDDPYPFDPRDAVVRRLWLRSFGMHLPRLPLVFDRLVQVILLQLVTWKSGLRAWHRLVDRFGQNAPGPSGRRVPPSAEAMLDIGVDDLVGLGISPRQARTLRRAARQAARIEAAAERGSRELGDALEAIPGIGPWTSGYVRGSALADPDAVLVGDYNLPSSIAWLLSGEEGADDERMLELLRPFEGNRFRVIRLVWMSGVKRAPRR